MHTEKMHKISIIIPMYNESRYIARCLDSLKNQSYRNFEIILIDDSSKDNTIRIAEGYKKDFKLTILKQQHGGPGKARNRGAKEAKGDILIFVDADMYFDSKLIESLIQPILKGKEIGTSHGWEYVGNLENRIARAYQSIRVHYDPDNNRSGIFRAILKSKFLERGGFDTNKGYTDDDLSKYGLSLHVPKAIIYHNNPEKLKEIFKHSIWVGSSLTKTGEIKNYIKKYMSWITIFFIFLIVSSIRLICNGLGQYIIIGFFIILIILLYTKAIERAIREQYLSHIIYIPLVMITRGIGYIVGGVKSVFFKKIY